MTSSQLKLNLVGGSVSFNFTPQAAHEFKGAIATLMERLKASSIQENQARGNRPAPQKSMEFYYQGDVFFEAFCNPNIWPTPFAAKVLITLRNDSIRMTTEADLTQIVDDLNQYLEQIN